MIAPPPVALTIAGSDCSAGAGLQADLKTFQHFRVHGLTAVTCVVSETAKIVRTVYPVPVEVMADQISLLFESFPVAAIKTGMLFSAAHVRSVAELLAGRQGIVVDPVMIASTGDSLLEPEALEIYKSALLPIARVITPNLPEAEALLGKRIPDAASLDAAARGLADLFGTAVLLKGGHLDGPDCIDVLADGGEIFHFKSPRIPLPGSHGTGCTLSAAIAAGLALGKPLQQAVSDAKAYLEKTLERSYCFPGHLHALDQATTF